MTATESFLWHDYETFGAQPLFDRPCQFAAIRTDPDLKPVGEPMVWYCAPADDVLPHPAACLITGITPQKARAEGEVEAVFADRIHREMMQPQTCSVGYNSIRFDDVFTRNLFYRNLMDPYEREWRNGNSRWDLIDLVRMCYALRPEGIRWPMRSTEEGEQVPSFKLEDLSRENAIQHAAAHDALSDVEATIGLARLLRHHQPRLYHWALTLRDQKTAMQLVDPVDPRPVLHTSARIPARRGCTTLELPLALLPDRPKSVVVFDLMADPSDLIQGSPQDIADRVFTSAADLPAGVDRIPLKMIHTNHVPMLAPAATLRDADPDRIGLDSALCQRHADQILAVLPSIRSKVLEVYAQPIHDTETSSEDPDNMLYSGSFFTPQDRHLMNKILSIPGDQLADYQWTFQDARLPVMLFRYRARNYPDTLSVEEKEAWDRDRTQRLMPQPDSRHFSYEEFRAAMATHRQAFADDGRAQRILDQLESWVQESGLDSLCRAEAGLPPGDATLR